MTTKKGNVLDIAIIGGGISGLYAGVRLLTGNAKGGPSPGKRIVVFELSGRTGGRLLTWRPYPEDPSLHAELGGMRFFRRQELIWSLITEHFKLKPVKFFVNDPNGNNIWYLRETILKTADLSNPDRVPYRLDARARYTDPFSLINNIVGFILEANWKVVAEHLDGRTTPENWEDWDKIKPYLRYRNRRLWDVGFWNLLWELLSPESYAYATDAFGYYSGTNNWNAAEAMQSIYADFITNPDYHTLTQGYDYVPFLLRQEFEKAGGEVRLNNPVTRITQAPDNVMELWVRGAEQPIRARHVILAMPRRALELLQETPLWNMGREVAYGKRLRDYVESVIMYPALKLFLAFQTPWWRSKPISIAAGRNVSDQPIRQTYFFPPVPEGFDPNNPPMKGPGLVMASYDDYTAVPFWRALEAPEERKVALKAHMRTLMASAPVASTRANAKAGALGAHIEETNMALADDPGFYYAPSEMVRYAMEQLQLIHFNQPIPDPIPLPGWPGNFLAAYKDWGHDPYGGGWNFWAPNIDVKRVMEQMRRPFADVNLYIVGEAYSGSQAWVEGALTTTEKMLREHFKLTRAGWQPEHYYMGY